MTDEFMYGTDNWRTIADGNVVLYSQSEDGITDGNMYIYVLRSRSVVVHTLRDLSMRAVFVLFCVVFPLYFSGFWRLRHPYLAP